MKFGFIHDYAGEHSCSPLRSSLKAYAKINVRRQDPYPFRALTHVRFIEVISFFVNKSCNF